MKIKYLLPKQPAMFNPNYTGITNYFTARKFVYCSAYSTRVGYQAGLGIEIDLSNRNGYRGYILSKAGISGPAGKDKFKINMI